MKKRRKTLSVVLSLLAGVCMLSGCIEEYEADIPAEDTGLLVVEGTICSAQLNTFILTRTQPVNSHSEPTIVEGASVIVHGSDGSAYAMQAADGKYSGPLPDLDPDVAYYLHIEADGEVYESEPQKPLPTEPVADVSLEPDTAANSIDVLVTPDIPFDPDKANYYSWTYDETWEVHPDYTTIIRFDTRTSTPVYDPHQFPVRGWKSQTGQTIMVGASLHYDDHHIRRLRLYAIDRSSERIYYKYSGLVRQRAISKAEYEYALARRQAGSEMGGLFTPLPSALPTNIHCLTSNRHAIGFVGCSLNTSERRFFLKAEDYAVVRPQPKDARKWLDDCNEMDCYRMAVKEGMFLCEWKDERYRPGGTLQTAWAYDYQLDVRLWGAYDAEPDYWDSLPLYLPIILPKLEQD